MTVKLSVNITIDDDRWNDLELDYYAILESITQHCLSVANLAIELEKIDASVEASLCLTDNNRIRELNRQFRGKDSPTDTLSFPCFETELLSEAKLIGFVALGDIVLSYDRSVEDCEHCCFDLTKHIKHLIIHSTMHLLGYDHQIDKEAEEMESLEAIVLERLGIDNPYK